MGEGIGSHAAGGPAPHTAPHTARHGTGTGSTPGPDTGPVTGPVTGLLEGIVQGCPDGLLATDAAGVVVWANAAAHALAGLPPGELAGRPLTDLAPAHLAGATDALVRRVLDGDRVGTVPATGLRADGSRFPCEVTPVARHAPDGRVAGLTATVRDVTGDRRVRRELTEELARSRARFDQAATPQALLDLELRFVAANDAACRLLGSPRDRLLGRQAPAYIDPVDEPATTARLDRLRSGASSAESFEATVRAQHDGPPVPVLVDVTVVVDAAGRPVELAVSATDLTEVQEARSRLVAQETFFSRLYRRSADPAMVVDATGRLRYVSPSFTRVLGHRAERVTGRPVVRLLHPDDVGPTQDALADLVAGRRRTARLVLRSRTIGGEWRWFDALATSCLDDPAIAGVVVNLREVTTEIEAREQLRRSESRYRAILETAQEGIIAVDPDGRVLFANDRVAALFGVSLEALYADGVLPCFPAEQRAWLADRIRARSELGTEQYELAYDHPTRGETLLVFHAAPLTEDDGSPVGALATVSDVTVERQVRDELRRAALHDPLTGLPNRMLLVDRLEVAEARLQREPGRGLAVLFLDLDDFKPVNDTHGHAVGDRLLVGVAERLAGAVREADTVARLGGDEFAVVCEESDVAEATTVAERILAALAEPFDVGEARLRVGASIGLAASPPDRPADLLGLADQAMYRSKARGRGRVTVHASVPAPRVPGQLPAAPSPRPGVHPPTRPPGG